MLVASSVAHFIVALYGIWLLQYRNRGFNSKIVTDLYIKVGTGLRPKPVRYSDIADFYGERAWSL